MEILVLGNSDTRGDFAAGETWPWVAGAVVEARSGESASVTERGYSAVRPQAPAQAEALARELRPDVVIMPLGTFAFSVGFTWVRVERLFGKRVARWYRKGESAIDRRTRGEEKQPNRTGISVRKLMRRLVGTAPMTTWQKLAENYNDAMRALARVEDVDVLLVAYPEELGETPTKKRSSEQRRRFLEAVSKEANRHHYRLVDSLAAYRDAPDPAALYTPDGFHSSIAGHQVMGTLVGEALVELISSRGD